MGSSLLALAAYSKYLARSWEHYLASDRSSLAQPWYDGGGLRPNTAVLWVYISKGLGRFCAH